MLYFTFAEKETGAWRAIYNGRFAFLLEFPPDKGLQVFADPGRPPEGLPENALKSLSEEQRHQSLLLDCPSSLFLNGLQVGTPPSI